MVWEYMGVSASDWGQMTLRLTEQGSFRWDLVSMHFIDADGLGSSPTWIAFMKRPKIKDAPNWDDISYSIPF